MTRSGFPMLEPNGLGEWPHLHFGYVKLLLPHAGEPVGSANFMFALVLEPVVMVYSRKSLVSQCFFNEFLNIYWLQFAPDHWRLNSVAG